MFKLNVKIAKKFQDRAITNTLIKPQVKRSVENGAFKRIILQIYITNLDVHGYRRGKNRTFDVRGIIVNQLIKECTG